MLNWFSKNSFPKTPTYVKTRNWICSSELLFTGTLDYHQHGTIDYHQPMVQETNLDMLKCILGSEDLGDKCINQNVLFMDELKIISLVLFPQASQPSINQKKFKSLYFTSVARSCHVSNKPKADIAVILPPFSPSMLRSTGTRKRKEVKRRNSIVVTTENRTLDLPHRGTRTNQVR